jgi:hypothetical protein
MAKKTKRRAGKASVIEQSLRDAQKVISGYIESGGQRVSDTVASLVDILQNQHLTEALSAGSRRISRAVTGRPKRATAKRRAGGARGKSKITPARKAVGKAAASAKRAAKSRVAASRAGAKRTASRK